MEDSNYFVCDRCGKNWTSQQAINDFGEASYGELASEGFSSSLDFDEPYPDPECKICGKVMINVWGDTRDAQDWGKIEQAIQEHYIGVHGDDATTQELSDNEIMQQNIIFWGESKASEDYIGVVSGGRITDETYNALSNEEKEGYMKDTGLIPSNYDVESKASEYTLEDLERVGIDWDNSTTEEKKEIIIDTHNGYTEGHDDNIVKNWNELSDHTRTIITRGKSDESKASEFGDYEVKCDCDKDPDCKTCGGKGTNTWSSTVGKSDESLKADWDDSEYEEKYSWLKDLGVDDSYKYANMTLYELPENVWSKVNEDYVNGFKQIMAESYTPDQQNVIETAEEKIISRKLDGTPVGQIARELVLWNDFSEERATKLVGEVEPSDNDMVAKTLFNKRYSECNESEIQEMELYDA
jgi:hypothetical protein